MFFQSFISEILILHLENQNIFTKVKHIQKRRVLFNMLRNRRKNKGLIILISALKSCSSFVMSPVQIIFKMED